MYTQEDCMSYRNQSCSIIRCNPYQCTQPGGFKPCGSISKEEKENWPKTGDATSIRNKIGQKQEEKFFENQREAYNPSK